MKLVNKILTTMVLTTSLLSVVPVSGYAATVKQNTAQTQASVAETAQAAEEKVEINVKAEITSCKITSDKSKVEIALKSNGDVKGTDGNVYLFEQKPYQDDLKGRKDYIGKYKIGQDASCSVDLNRNTENDRLYSKFVTAVYDGENYVEVSSPYYITNPEVVAENQKAFDAPLTKKGLNVELNMLSDAFDLGVKHVGTNIAFHQILGSGIDFQYDGKTYHFSKSVVEQYDQMISAFSGKNMTVTAILLNGWNDATPDLIYPGTKKSSNAFYYLFNAKTKEGFDETRAIAAFLAKRYDGSNPNYGKISNWIIGNEINNQQWNYTGDWDIESYVKAYQKAFRVFYTAIKSTSANDRVYFSLDYNWNNEADGKLKYGGKDIVDYFNSVANKQGQFDWGIAYHPYPAPMTEPEFWDDAQKTGLIKQDPSSPIINFANLKVFTDYMANDARKAPNGKVRHIILTEEGFTATNPSRGKIEDAQAAAFAYSYYLVDSNPYIDAYILSRQVDSPTEVKQGLSFGLWTCSMNTKNNEIIALGRRKIWEVFKNIDKKKNTLEATEFAKSIIGINKWSDVVPDFKWRSLEQ